MRSLLLGNGYEINFNPNMRYDKILELIVNDKEKFISFLKKFLSENFFFFFYLQLFEIKEEEIYSLILKNIIFYDNTKSIEDNLNTIFNDIENFFQRINKKPIEEEISKRILKLQKIWIDNDEDFYLISKENFKKTNSLGAWNIGIDKTLEPDLDTFFTNFFVSKIRDYQMKNKKYDILIQKIKEDKRNNRKFLIILTDSTWDSKEDFNLPVRSFFEDKLIEKIIKNFFCFYIQNEFYKTKLTMELFFKTIPACKIFLESYDQIMTTNYNDYSFLNKNTINIHGKINDQKQPIIWFERTKEKKNIKKICQERNINIIKYNEIDLMGLSLKNDENTVIDVINCSSEDDLVINYYAFNNYDKMYFIKIIDEILEKYKITPINRTDSPFSIEFQRQGYILGNENQRRFVKIFVKDSTNDFWGFSSGTVRNFWNDNFKINVQFQKDNNGIKVPLLKKDSFLNLIQNLLNENYRKWNNDKENILRKVNIFREMNNFEETFYEFQKILLTNEN